MLHRAAAALTALLLLVGLSSCGKVDVTMKFWDEQAMDFAMDINLATTPEDAPKAKEFLAQVCVLPYVLGKKVEFYSEAGVEGCRAGGHVPAQVLNDMGGTITREGDTMTVELPTKSLHDDIITAIATGEFTGLKLEELDLHVAMTFPGEVLEHSGRSTVDGTTVTWRDPADLKENLTASGRVPKRIVVPAVVGSVTLVATISAIVMGFTRRPRAGRQVLEKTHGNPH